jgi:hypothetical protein
MNSFIVVVFVCASGIGQSDCNADTALDVIRGPKVASEITCGLHGQATVASLARPIDTAHEYIKIGCHRVHQVAEVPPAFASGGDVPN